MSKSKLGSTTPTTDLGTNGDVFNRFENGISAPVNEGTAPGFEVGISVPTGDGGTPGFEIGIGAPTSDNISIGGTDGSLGAWEDVIQLNITEDNDEGTYQKGGGANVDPTAANPSGGNIGTLLNLGTNPDGSHFFTGIRNVDATLIGSKWGTTNLTYSFPTSGTNYADYTFDSNGVNNLHLTLGTQQQAAARAAFAQLSALTGLTFTEITDTDTVHANIRISQTADNDAPSAYGNFPSDTRPMAGDIWFGRTNQPYYDLAFKGTWGYATMMHEIGHTMGLKHGHQDYTNSDLSFYFGTFPRVGSQSLTPDRDGQAWSLMTYTPAPFTNSNFAGEKISQPQTYMQYDIAALQYLYGANFNTNSGDSVYTFSQTTGEMFINGVGQGAPSGNKIFLTIWDGGGNDTIDASNYANGVTIDLRPGEYSTVDQNQVVNNLAFQNLVSLAPGNFAMSLLYNNDARSLIENVKGGIGNDLFVGNTANNVLDGGAGSDTVVFTNTSGVTVTLNDTNTDVIVSHDGETDTLRSIENIGGTSGNDTITGNSLDNVLTGGSGGVDTLTGNGGNDRLVGSSFTIAVTYDTTGVTSQADITKAAATNNNSIANAVNTAGFFDIDANANITNATTIPHATINATATGGSLEYYRVDVTAAGAQAIFDIDGAGSLGDSIIELVNSAGVLLATNDTGPGDPGTTVNDDAYITYTFAAPGTYYLRVGQWTGTSVAQPLTAGMTYTLHISVQGAAGTTIFTPSTGSLVADGGAGNDVVVGTLASDTLSGGADNDTVSYVNAYSNGSTTGVTVDLNLQGAAQNTVAAGTDTLSGFENLIGSALNDTLTGDGGNNIIEGGLGNDILAGGLGTDTASYAGATAGVTVSLALQGAGQNTVNAGTDTLSGFENLLGSAFADSLTGDATANTLTGGDGNDTLNPGANAGGTIDLLDGGIGSDTASFAGVASGVTATLNGASDGAAAIAGGTIATLRNIENLTGSSNNDTLTGDGNNNVIEGGLGDDVLNGGGGIDTVRFTGSTAVTLNLTSLVAQNTGWGNDVILGFENVATGSGADNITGDGNDNTFFDGGGSDTYNGGAGIDTVDYSAATSTVNVDLNVATASRGTFGGTDTLTSIENVVGAASFGNTLQGNALANRLTGGAAADTMIGFDGSDFLIGGAGNDLLLGGNGGGIDDATSDTVEGGAGNDFISGGQGDDILRGGDGDDTLVGGAGNTSGQFFTGVDGGNDTYDGGDGTDVAIAVYDTRAGALGSTVGIAFDLGNLLGNSNITFNGAVVGSMTSIERITFRGTLVDDNVRGGGTLDSLTGGAGNDVLDGWYGNDLLDGGIGNDTLIGGEGLDTATYVNAGSGVTVDLRIAGPQDTIGYGIDTLSGIEYLVGSAFGDTLRGNDVFNLIIDSGVGAGATAGSQTDSLFGYGGNDSILATRAAAAVATNLNMDGGDGDDFIELRGGALSVALTTNAAGLSATTTGATQTYLVAGATSNDRNLDVVNVNGGDGNDRIILTGVAAATIYAGSGNDLVSISMRGASSVNNYNITLGAGADIIQFGVGANAAASTDVMTTIRTSIVTDFAVGNSGDKFEMTDFLSRGVLAGSGYVAGNGAFVSGHMKLTQSGEDLLLQVDRDGTGVVNSFVTVFTIANTYTGGFTAFNFDGFIGNLTLSGIGSRDETITGATGNDILSGNDGNDVLIGLGGNDTLDGGNGNDVLRGGAGDDVLIGGIGTDTADYSDAAGPVSINLFVAGPQNTGGAGNDTLTGIENLVGSAFGDTFLTNDVANRIDGGGGDDWMYGGLGNDTLNGDAGTDTAAYTGNRSEFTIVYQYDGNGNIVGFLSVTDNLTTGGSADLGTDTLTSIEVLSFDDVVLNASLPIQLFNGAALIGTFSTIQAAVNAAVAGNTISVVAGTYNENVTIDKDVTIVGANDGIDGTGTRGAETVINGQIVIAADGVTIDGVSVVGAAAGPLGSTGIIVNVGADNFSLVNSILNGTGDYAMFVGGAGGATGLNVAHNLIEGYTVGIYVSDNDTAGAIHDNLFQGANAGYGIGLGDGITSETSQVIINGNTFDGLYGNSLNLAPFGPNPVDINTYVFDNFFSNSGVERPIQIHPTADSTNITGTDEHEAFYDVNQGLPGELAASLEFHGRGGDDHAYGNSLGDALYGDDGNDQLFGFGGDDLLVGGAGNDLLDGETGIDTAQFADTGGLVFSDTVIGWLVSSSEGNDFLQRTEIAIDSAGQRNLLVGSTAFANIQAAFGVTQTGDDIRLAAGNYSGTVNYSAADLTVIASPGAVQNVTYATAGTNGITILAGNGNDKITTGAGADYLDGGAGADQLAGGAGNDIYIVDNAGDVVTEAAGQGFDVVYTKTSYTLTNGSEIEGLSTLDWNSTAAINLTGNSGDNYIFGNAGDNQFNGGAGADAMFGFGGNDTYIVDNAGDQVIETAGNGFDVVFTSVNYHLAAGSEVEGLVTLDATGTGAINLTGNEIVNFIVGNNGDNVIDGGAGADQMDGRGGNDSYIVDNAGDIVIEASGGGYDVAYTTTSYTLNDAFEVEGLSTLDWNGTAAINLTGNSLSNYIIGNDGVNVLNGGAGSDVLVGRGGGDTFAFTTALGVNNVDQIVDFAHGSDKIALDHGIFGLGVGGLNPNAFVVGTQAGDGDDRIIYNQATGELFYDADGSGAGAAVLFATLSGNPTLSASDFSVI